MVRRWIVVGLVATTCLHTTATRAEEPVSERAEHDAVAHASATVVPDTAIRPEFTLTVATYIVPHERDYAQPTLAADYEWLHVEGRYNYESYDAASLWFGCNVSLGEKLTLDFTPMVGGVFGDVSGVAPGFKLTLGLWKIELYSEAEYLFDTNDHESSFAYMWSELSLAPVDWLRFGIVSQRTKAYETDVEFQRGLFAGLTYGWLSLTTYVFNIDQSEQTVVLSVGASL